MGVLVSSWMLVLERGLLPSRTLGSPASLRAVQCYGTVGFSPGELSSFLHTQPVLQVGKQAQKRGRVSPVL